MKNYATYRIASSIISAYLIFYSSIFLIKLNQPLNRRTFLTTTGKLAAAVVITGIACNDKKPAGTVSEDGRVNNYKKKTLAGTFPAVQQRGWQQNVKTKKIHFFDDKGYTPALWYVKDRSQFDSFMKNLAPFDHNQLTLDVYNSSVSKKYKQWIAEHAALSFSSRGQHENAFAVLQHAIQKRPVNYRLWDLAAAITYTPGHEVIRATFETMLTQYSGHSDQRLRNRIEKYASFEWQQKRLNKPGATWNRKNIRAEVF